VKPGLARLGATAGRRVGVAEVVAWDSSQPHHLGVDIWFDGLTMG